MSGHHSVRMDFPFNEHVPEYTIHDSLTLPIATNAQEEIVGAALSILRAKYPKPMADSRPDRPDMSFHFKKLALSCGKSHPTILASKTSSTPSTEASKKADGGYRRHQPEEWLWHHTPGHTRHRLPIRPETRVHVEAVYHEHP